MLALNDEDTLAIRQKLKDDFEHYASRCLKIRTKEGKVIPFQLNQAQKYFHNKCEEQLRETGQVRQLVLKGRQEGISTYTEARFYWKVTHRKGVRAFILTHDQGATNNLFEMAQRYHEHCPILVRPQCSTSNAKELYFGKLDSGYKVGTAGNKGVGRSATIQYFHGSEAAFWPNAELHAQGILQTIPAGNQTEIILESTANGVGNYFYQQWQLAESGQSDFKATFIPWFWMKEYRRVVNDEFYLNEDEETLRELYGLDNEQLNWRRYKIMELSSNGIEGAVAFQQEYPCNAMEAFAISSKDALLKPQFVMRARKTQNIAPSGPKVLGVDPSRFGDDRTSLIRRQGRVAYGLESYMKKDTMEIAGRVYQLDKSENFARIFIDVVGIGAGVVDRLVELGLSHKIVAVNAGETRSVLNREQYYNKRAEMWGEMKKWFEGDLPVSIPDSDSLYADLCGQKYDFTSISQLKLVSKKEENLRSPDEADALSLTFAEPLNLSHQSELVSTIKDIYFDPITANISSQRTFL